MQRDQIIQLEALAANARSALASAAEQLRDALTNHHVHPNASALIRGELDACRLQLDEQLRMLRHEINMTNTPAPR